jgi:hypothetical protein
MTLRFTALLLLAFLVHPVQAQETGEASGAEPPAMDFSGTDHFYRIASVLKRGKNPDREQWSALLSAPGYHHYFADQDRNSGVFKQLMRVVFMPSEEKALQDTLKSLQGDFRSELRPLHVLLAAKGRRDALEQFRKQIRASNVRQQAVEEASALLPEEALGGREDRSPPPVNFVIYNLDGRGTADGVVVDLTMAEIMGRKGTRLFLAHEFHHAGRESILQVPDRKQDPRAFLLRAFDQLQAEGIADLISKPYLNSSGGVGGPRPSDMKSASGRRWCRILLWGFAQKHQKAYHATPSTVGRVDSLLVAAAEADREGDNQKLRKRSREVLRSIPNNGHPNGHYMAQRIADQFGTDTLAATANDPFAFVRLYTEAARESSGRSVPFSEEAMAYLAILEKRYTGEAAY